MIYTKLLNFGDKNVYKILDGRLENTRPLRKPKHGWENNNKVDNKDERIRA